jgi:alkylated DNA repair dioxygenase AlkB
MTEKTKKKLALAAMVREFVDSEHQSLRVFSVAPTAELFLHKVPPAQLAQLVAAVEEAEPDLKKGLVTVFAKTYQTPRTLAFFSDEVSGYKYSRHTVLAHPVPSEMNKLMAFVNERFGAQFNAVLVNSYADGTETIGRHRDDEKAISKAGVVAISFGAERCMTFRDSSGRVVADVPLLSGMLLQMAGADFQTLLTHEINKDLTVTVPRVSLTFREHTLEGTKS